MYFSAKKFASEDEQGKYRQNSCIQYTGIYGKQGYVWAWRHRDRAYVTCTVSLLLPARKKGHMHSLSLSLFLFYPVYIREKEGNTNISRSYVPTYALASQGIAATGSRIPSGRILAIVVLS